MSKLHERQSVWHEKHWQKWLGLNGYLANIENQGAIPSLPVMIQLIKVCGLPVERYFNPEIMREESEQRQRVSHKLKLCPEEYLPIIEGAIDGALKMEQTAKQKEDA